MIFDYKTWGGGLVFIGPFMFAPTVYHVGSIYVLQLTTHNLIAKILD